MSDVQRLSVALADRYTVERELGRGGTATVYLARSEARPERLLHGGATIEGPRVP
jgi:hypothetical protein